MKSEVKILVILLAVASFCVLQTSLVKAAPPELVQDVLNLRHIYLQGIVVAATVLTLIGAPIAVKMLL